MAQRWGPVSEPLDSHSAGEQRHDVVGSLPTHESTLTRRHCVRASAGRAVCQWRTLFVSNSGIWIWTNSKPLVLWGPGTCDRHASQNRACNNYIALYSTCLHEPTALAKKASIDTIAAMMKLSVDDSRLLQSMGATSPKIEKTKLWQERLL